MKSRVRNWAEHRAFESPKTYSGNKFSGILLEPIVSTHFPDHTGDPDKDTKLDEVRELIWEDTAKQYGDRLTALLDHYGIRIVDGENNEPALTALVVKMAKDFLPGFQLNIEPPPKSRPLGSTTVGGEDLFDAVNARIRNGTKTIKAACEYLSRHSSQYRNHSPASLEVAYHRFSALCRESYQYMTSHPIYGVMIDTLGFEGLLDQMGSRAKASGTKPPPTTKR